MAKDRLANAGEVGSVPGEGFLIDRCHVPSD